MDGEAARRDYRAPYSQNHLVPTVQKYRQDRDELQSFRKDAEKKQFSEDGQAAMGDVKNSIVGASNSTAADDSANGKERYETKDSSSSESTGSELECKETKYMTQDNSKREVTNLFTHSPLIFGDFAKKDEKRPAGELGAGISRRFHNGSELTSTLFPPLYSESSATELSTVYQSALTVGLGSIGVLAASTALAFAWISGRSRHNTWWNMGFLSYIGLGGSLLFSSVAGATILYNIRGWLKNRVKGIWKEQLWEVARSQEENSVKDAQSLPESAFWMNRLLASVWPLINPDLFASIIDMLEDVMQASLPNIIQMVSVDDLDQGSQPIRILSIRWLPETSNGRPLNEDRDLVVAFSKGLHATPDESEFGDFVNMELSFSYTARPAGNSIKSKSKNAHLYLKFYLPGGIFIPVWVELRGMVGTMRLRLQVAPDPPFFSLCNLTFVDQPQAEISCVLLSKNLPNLMDVPFISSFVQSSIDAAMAEYVAPKSLTLDLKDMLSGDDFKKDTLARGVIAIFINEASGFKQGDRGLGAIKGSSDAYVTCSWGKFGRSVCATRVIKKEQNPKWCEWAYILVTPVEINAEEKLTLILWDSDKYTADDDLGRVEIELKQLMQNEKTINKMCEREDRFRAQDPKQEMPGTLIWSVGYYTKTPISETQIKQQTQKTHIRTKEELKKYMWEKKEKEREMRETRPRDESMKIEQRSDQQYDEDYRRLENAMICSAPPDPEFPSGVLSIHIHNILGLEVESMATKDETVEREDHAEQSKDLPSSYCTIILNHEKIFKTRTKPKNAKPFFNASTEKFIRDWTSTEIIISVRDQRAHENDALLGIVHLPLAKLFGKTSQVVDAYPLVGGIGFGRMRISLIFRSVEMQMPIELRGWDVGTLEIIAPIRAKTELPNNLEHHRIKLQSNLSKVKMLSQSREWYPIRDKESVFLPYKNRYASPLLIEFQKSSIGLDSTPAFAVLWPKDIPDEEEKNLTLQVWKGGEKNLERATKCPGYDGLDDGQLPLGEIEVKTKFWHGLSGYHKHYAYKANNAEMQDVMEVLDTVHDEIPDSDSDSDNEAEGKHKIGANDYMSDSSDAEVAAKPFNDSNMKNLNNSTLSLLGRHHPIEDAAHGLQTRLREFKDHHKQLHRKHRGIMQWKAMRTADRAVDAVRHGTSRIGGIFHHREKSTGVETEI